MLYFVLNNLLSYVVNSAKYKSMKQIFFPLIALLIFGFSACKKTDTASQPTLANFSFATTKNVELNIQLFSNQNQPLTGIPVTFYASQAGVKGDVLFKSVTNNSGSIIHTLEIPAYLDTLIVDPAYVGLMTNASVYAVNNRFSCTIGGNSGYSGNIAIQSILPQPSIKFAKGIFDINGVATNTQFIKTYTAATATGVPNNIESDLAPITADMLSYLNYSIPERQSVVNLRPQYLLNTSTSNLIVTKESDVWVTFVCETTAAKSSLGYYVYPTNNPPKTLADIDSIRFVFPNCSGPGSGGGLVSGSRVKLGRFQPNTTIGFVLYAGGWGGDGNVNTATAKAYFTDSYLNPETNPDYRKHTVLLQYNDYLFVGFDDGNRNPGGGSDNDFNDVVFTATSNPVDAFDRTKVDQCEAPVDSDNDGVLDLFDAYPNDPARAYNNYYPGVNTWGTLMFEDQWPNYGDYDLNDLVVRYKYQYVTNAQGRVVELFGNFVPTAAGALYLNGFGVQFGFSNTLVQSVTGQVLTSNYIQLNNNGTEAGQSKAVIIPFDNYSALTGNTPLVNTDKTRPTVSCDTANIKISFVSPITTTTLAISSLNPFLISDLKRGREVHLPKKLPTDKADLTLLGTGIDYYNAASGITYISRENYPWALSFTENVTYPKERVNIKDAYLNFTNWATSNGTTYTDWYKNTASGYRNSSNLY